MKTTTITLRKKYTRKYRLIFVTDKTRQKSQVFYMLQKKETIINVPKRIIK